MKAAAAEAENMVHESSETEELSSLGQWNQDNKMKDTKILHWNDSMDSSLEVAPFEFDVVILSIVKIKK